MNPKHITLEQLRDRVARACPITDRVLTADDRFDLIGSGPTTNLVLADMPVTPVTLYQIKAMGGEAVKTLDITDFKGKLSRARSNDEKQRPEAERQLERIAAVLNGALSGRDLEARPLTMRLAKDGMNRDYVGGVVSDQYAPLTHLEFVDRMLEHPGFKGALVHKYKVSAARLEFMMLLEGHEWDTDGGIKSGISGGNGQFGDKSASLWAMLFRLLCTNGMMDVLDKAGMRRRHTGSNIDLSAELRRVLAAAEDLYGASVQSMGIECDVVDLLTESYRRGLLTRGAFRKSLDRRQETMGGQVVEGATTTLWGASQAITAAARDYSYGQDAKMGEFAGRLVRAGAGFDNVIKMRPINPKITDHEEILSSYGLAA